jgi:50S ribosomal subunit-associated GTPase HflX
MNALEKVPVVNKTEDAPVETSSTQIEKDNKATVDISKQRKSILDRFGEKLKEFLDNA